MPRSPLPKLYLSSLEPKFYRIDVNNPNIHIRTVLNRAQGVMFLCPTCYLNANESRIGVHSILVWFKDRGVSDDKAPEPRWNVSPSSTDEKDLTLTPSIAVRGGCCSHFHIRNGIIEMCD